MYEEFEREVIDQKKEIAEREKINRKLNMDHAAESSELCEVFQVYKLDIEEKKHIITEMLKDFKHMKLAKQTK